MKRTIYQLKNTNDAKIIMNFFYFLLILKDKPDHIKVKFAQTILESDDLSHWFRHLISFKEFTYHDIETGSHFIELFSDQYLNKNHHYILGSDLKYLLENLNINNPIIKLSNFHRSMTTTLLEKSQIYVPNKYTNIEQLVIIIKKQLSYKLDRITFFNYKIFKLLDSLPFRKYTIRFPKTSKELTQWSLILENCLWSHVATVKDHKMFVFGLFDPNGHLFAAFSVQDNEFKDINGLRNSLDVSPEFVYSLKVFVDDYIDDCIKHRQHTLYDNNLYLHWFSKK
jgi:hypothetical protein